MIIILKPGATDEQIDHVIERVESLGLNAHLSRGTYRTIIGVIGDESQFQPEQLQAIPGVADVIRVLPPYKLASNEAHPRAQRRRRRRGEDRRRLPGDDRRSVCGRKRRADGRDRRVGAKPPGANILRGGAFKPRTSPYAYQGMGEEGLKILREVGDKHGMPVVTEVMDPRRVELVDRYADMIQIGARNMQNFTLLTEVGQTQEAGAAEARHERHGRRPADERRVHPVARQPERRALRARRQELRHRRRAICSTWPRCRPARGSRTCRSSSIRATPPAGPI